jgi:serine/threonine protein kinase
MVILHRISLTTVLLSYIHLRWKIADFGSTAEGTSKRLRTTITSRGTAVYRGPELLDEDSGYTSKTDIWAFGCIAYELCTKKKAFASDWATREYKYEATEAPKEVFTGEWPRGPSVDITKEICQICVDNTLRISWQERPSASELLTHLTELRQR